MASTKAHIKASVKWRKENYSRIPLDVPKAEHERLKAIAEAAGTTLNGFIKQAIAEKIERDKEKESGQN